MYTSTCPRNINFKYQKNNCFATDTAVTHARNPTSHVAQALCPGRLYYRLLSFSASVHAAYNISSFFPISDTSNLFIACPDRNRCDGTVGAIRISLLRVSFAVFNLQISTFYDLYRCFDEILTKANSVAISNATRCSQRRLALRDTVEASHTHGWIYFLH